MRILMIALGLAAASLLGSLTSPGSLATQDAVGLLSETPTTLPGESRITASLPDGTQFLVTAEPGLEDDWLGTTASIVVEVGGSTFPVGEVRFHPDVPNAEYSYQDGSYRIPAAGVLVEVEFDPRALEALGPNPAAVIEERIRGNSEYGFPVLRLREPFGWGEDEPNAVGMTVRFADFEVRRGCGERAAVCSPEGSLQLIWGAAGDAATPTPQLQELRIFRLVP